MYPKKTQFPIFDHVDAGKFKGCTSGVPAQAVSIIESLQPYHRRDAAAIKSDPLWRLNKLCNIDKHRRIPTDAVASDYSFPDFPRQFVSLIEFDNDAGVISIPLSLKSKMTLDPTAAVHVFFGDSYEGVRCNFTDLESIYDFVTVGVIPRFTGFFK